MKTRRLSRVDFGLLISFAVLTLATPAGTAAREGLFYPGNIQPQFDQGRVLSSMVRITENIYWDVIVLNDDASASTLRKSFRYYEGSGYKTYLPQGAILWHIVLGKSALLKLMEDPASPFTAGIADIVRSFKDVQAFPAERITPISIRASATFITADGLLLTNYHVVREQIEALGRERGCAGDADATYLSAEVPIVERGGVVGWRPLHHIALVANLSEKDWQAGLDGALLRSTDRIAHGYLRVADNPPLGEPVWQYGFPFATARASAALQAGDYSNADGSLRVSTGTITRLRGADFITDSDGISGNSGGPVVNAAGDLVGYVWDVYPDSEAATRYQRFAGGMINVSAATALRALQAERPC